MTKPILSDQDYSSVSRILNLLPGVQDGEPATMAQLKSAVEGLAWKDSARVRAPGNLTIASPGATIDGITMAVGDRVLAPNQTTGSENGIYVWSGATSPLTRALDANTADELEAAVITVEEGTSGGATYRQTLVNFTLGTGTPNFVSFGASAGAASESTAGIAQIATQAETDAGTNDSKFITPLKLTAWGGRTKNYTGTIGDGAATQIDLAHNFGKRNVTVEVWYNSGNYDTVICDVQRPTLNTVRLKFASAPATNSVSAVVIG